MHKQGPGQGTSSLSYAMASGALWLGTNSPCATSSHCTGTGRALPHGSATMAAGLPVLPFIYVLLIYFILELCSDGSSFMML